VIAFQKDSSSFPIQGAMPDTAGGEHYARMVDRLLAMKGTSGQVFVTSPDAGEGKSVTAVNLAYALHARNISVLLAELSFERPIFAKIFGGSPSPFGIQDVLAMNMPLSAVVCERMDGLKVALAGGTQVAEPGLEPGPAFDRLLSEVRESFEWTIFDAPPVASMPEIASSLAASTGIPLVVARARQTSSRALLDAIARIDHPETVVLLNDA
jgi:succinoglycan biosynthesis transport protein ExoP